MVLPQQNLLLKLFSKLHHKTKPVSWVLRQKERKKMNYKTWAQAQHMSGFTVNILPLYFRWKAHLKYSVCVCVCVCARIKKAFWGPFLNKHSEDITLKWVHFGLSLLLMTSLSLKFSVEAQFRGRGCFEVQIKWGLWLRFLFILNKKKNGYWMKICANALKNSTTVCVIRPMMPDI